MAADFGYEKVVTYLRKSFRTGVMRSYESRMTQLNQLDKMLIECKEDLQQALYKDLHTSKRQFQMGDYLMARNELKTAQASLKTWMYPEKVKRDLPNKMNTIEIRSDPLGVVLIIAAWNYPIGILIAPLVAALSGGNCVVIKPSEVAINCSNLFKEIIPKYFKPEIVQVICGGVPETTALLKQRFDHILYTGNSSVAKIVMRAASEYLTPVTLELGGKNPCIVDDTCDFHVMAQRVAWGKFINSGQVCIAPDYILYIGDNQEKLVEAFKTAIVKFYGENSQESEQYGRIINQRHFQRVCNLIDESKVVFGNVKDAEDLYISPTILTNVTPDDAIMQEEVFGPVLPIISSVRSIEDAIQFVNDREKPLALYCFSNDSTLIEKVSTETSSGGVTINDTLMHAANPNLPFGGVGNSGTGRYRGKFSFECFTHKKSFLYKSQGMEFLNELRYASADENSKMYRAFEWSFINK